MCLTDSYEYDGFGNQISSTGSTPNVYLYRGEAYDSDLGLYYLRARYYNPLTGRFMSRDPENGLPWLPMTLHKYLYAASNPINRVDPSGRADFLESALVIERDIELNVPFLNTLACATGIGFAAAGSSLEAWQDKASLGLAIYGCATVAWSPTGTFLSLVKSGVDLGACAFSISEVIRAYNDYADHPNSLSSQELNTLFLNSFSGAVGCGITGLQRGLEAEE
jgi:RHS repeat-associated protein